MKSKIIILGILLGLILLMYVFNPKQNDFQKHRYDQLFQTAITQSLNAKNQEEKDRPMAIRNDIVMNRTIVKDYKLFSIEYLDVSKELSAYYDNQNFVMISFGVFGRIFDLDKSEEYIYMFTRQFYQWKEEYPQPNGVNNVQYNEIIGLKKSYEIIESSNQNINSLQTLKIGDHYGGGIVAYLLSKNDGVCLKPEGRNDTNDWDGKFEEKKMHGIIVSENDLNISPVEYGKVISFYHDTILSWQSHEIGTSKLNTNLVPDRKDDYISITNDESAISLCKSYNGGGFKDWAIPSIQELNILFLYKDYIGKFRNDFYWSSSFLTSGRLPYWQYWIKNFYSGNVFPTNGSLSYNYLANLRVVRYF